MAASGDDNLECAFDCFLCFEFEGMFGERVKFPSAKLLLFLS